MTLDELHEQRKELDIQLEVLEAKQDRAKQRYEELVNALIHMSQFSKPKAEAKVQLEERDWYMKMRDLIREYKAKERQANRAKSEYYHQRRKEDSWKSLDIEASR